MKLKTTTLNKLKAVVSSEEFQRRSTVHKNYMDMRSTSPLRKTFYDVVQEKVESHSRVKSLLERAKDQMEQKMIKLTNSSGIEEQISNIYKKLAKQHHDGFLFMKNKILSDPDYFDNDYRNLNSYIKEHVQKKV